MLTVANMSLHYHDIYIWVLEYPIFCKPTMINENIPYMIINVQLHD